MKKNMGSADRAIRFVAAAVVISLFLTNAISGTLAIILLMIAGIFLITSFIGACPLYTLLNIRSYKK